MAGYQHGQLWQFGTKRCVITPPFPASPPHRVVVFKGDAILSDRAFQSHNEAVEDAIAELRAAVRQPFSSNSP